jgi:hypothetical protein
MEALVFYGKVRENDGMEAMVFYGKYGKMTKWRPWYSMISTGKLRNGGLFSASVDSRVMVKSYSAIAEWFCYPPLQSVIFIAIDIAESVSPLSPAKCLEFLGKLV